jgi:transposase
MAWVEGKPKPASERYLGSAAEIEALLDAREHAILPQRTRHLAFGGVAAVWGMLTRLDVPGVIDSVLGPRRSDAGATTGTYLALAVLNRVVAPCSTLAFADWWRTTAADRFTRIAARVLDHRKFWEAMHTLTLEQLAQIEHRVAVRIVEEFGVDIGLLALDMTNFATFIDTGNTKAPIARRGKAAQKRADLRLVGLGLVVSRDGGIPLVSLAYPGNKPDVNQFTTVIDLLRARHAALAEQAGAHAPVEMTVVFDAGQNSAANFAHLADTGLRYVGSVRTRTCPICSPCPRRDAGSSTRTASVS